MRRLLVTLGFAMVLLVAGAPAVPDILVEPADAPAATPHDRPLVFEPNRGQMAPEAEYSARSRGGTLFLTRDAAVLSLANFEVEREHGELASVRPAGQATMTMRWLGANADAMPSGVDLLLSHSTYFRGGGDPSTAQGIRTEHFGAVRYESVYDGVDLVFGGDEQSFEYDFIVAPGADPGAIRLGFQGAESMSIDASGDLLMEVGSQVLVHRAPIVFQNVRASDGTEARRTIAGSFVLVGPHQVEFEIGAYDRGLPLVIDPKVNSSTYWGGASTDSAEEIVEADTDSIYVAGWTCSAKFPTKSPLQGTNAGGCDAFISAFTLKGKLLGSTYFGGSANDHARSIHLATPASGRGEGSRAAPYVYVTGDTQSVDFPMKNAIQTPRGDTGDVWVSVFTERLDELLFSTALGGDGFEFPNDITTNAHGYIIITGGTESKNWPLVDATQKKFLKPRDAFVAMLNPALGGGASTLDFSTRLGGKGSETGYGVALSSTTSARGSVDECIHVAGITNSKKKFPIEKALQKKIGGAFDAFLAMWCNVLVKPTLVYSSYYGGKKNDFAHDLVHDSADRDVIAIETHSDNLAVTANAIQATHAGNGDAGLAVFDLSGLRARFAGGGARSAGAKMVFATYHGGSQLDAANGVAVDKDDIAHITGLTRSTDIPTVKPLQAHKGAADVLVAKIDYGADSLRQSRVATPALLFASPFGGAGDDVGNGICVDRKLTQYIVGFANSTNYPTKKPAQKTNAGGFDAIITSIKR